MFLWNDTKKNIENKLIESKEITLRITTIKYRLQRQPQEGFFLQQNVFQLVGEDVEIDDVMFFINSLHIVIKSIAYGL